MRYGNWIVAALWSAMLLLAFGILSNAPEVHSGGRFDNPHDDIACTECHVLRADLDEGLLADTRYRKECERCHDVSSFNVSGIPLNFHQVSDKSCSQCHSFHNLEKIDAGDHQFLVSFENSNQRGQCYSCHGPSESTSLLSPGHRYAAQIYHSDFRVLGRLAPSETCLMCHSENRPIENKLSADQSVKPPLFDEHGAHPVNIRVAAGQGEPGNKIRKTIDPRIRLFGGRIECQTCHSLSSDKPHHLVGFESQNALCRACHEID